MARKATRGERLFGAAFALLVATVLRIDDSFGQPRMDCDVVQLTEGILQFLQSSHEAPSARSFLAWEGASKEFRGVPELLGLKAHLMPPLRVELAELCTRFQQLLPTPPQLVGGSADDRLFSQHACKIPGVARPVAGFDPARSVENKATKACGFDGRAGARKGSLASLLEVLGEDRHSRSIGFAVCDRLHNATDEYMEFTRWALSFPKIISARSDDAIRTELAWR